MSIRTFFLSLRRRFFSYLHPKNSLTALAVTAAMTAASVVLCRYLGFSPENSAFRFDLGFLPLAVVAYLLGPIYAGGGYLCADIIGSLLSGYAPNIWISGCKLLFGIGMGVAFYRKKPTCLRTLITFLLLNLLVDVALMTPALIFLYGMPPAPTYLLRLINAGITLPIRFFAYFLLLRAIEKPLSHVILRWSNKENAFLRYANSFQAVTVPGLERIRALLQLLGNPQNSLRCLHIAGTNGKGSVSACLAEIFGAAGYRVGKYTSPNLIRVNERITVDGEEISDEELAAVLAEIEPLSEKVMKNGNGAPTQFEIWTAAAFLYFSRKKCHYVVLEVGLGGEFDATNVIEKNEIAVITRLDIDHAQYLGNTISEIAHAKSGIMKADSAVKTVITVPQSPEAMAVLEERARVLGLSLSIASPTPVSHSATKETFTLSEIALPITCGIPGYHQIENAALAALAAKALGIEEEKILEGIARAKNPARFEVIREDPLLLFDGGHNKNGIKACNDSFIRYFGDIPRTVIFAAMSDKDISESLALLNDGRTDFLFTTVKDNPRAATAEELAAKAATLGIVGQPFDRIEDAIHTAYEMNTPILICGSLYLYKDVTDALKKIGK